MCSYPLILMKPCNKSYLGIKMCTLLLLISLLLAPTCHGLRQVEAYNDIIEVLAKYKQDVNVQTWGLLGLARVLKDGEWCMLVADECVQYVCLCVWFVRGGSHCKIVLAGCCHH